jgi:hypothetical protein
MKTILIVDAPYLHSLIRMHGRYDIVKLAKRLECDIGLEFDELQYFDALDSTLLEKSNSFYRWLETRSGSPKITVRNYKPSTYSVCCPRCDALVGKYTRTAMTMGIATLLISSAAAGEFDSYVICSGVSGLYEPIEHIRKVQNCNVVVCGFRGATSIASLGSSYDIFWLDDIWAGILPS